MPPQTNTIQDFYKQIELDRLYAGKSSGMGLIKNDQEIGPSLLDFIEKSIATTEGIKPEETSYGRAIAKLTEEYGSPFIKGQKQPLGGDYRATYKRDRRNPILYDYEKWPVDTINVQYGDTGGLIAELAHAKQFTKNPLKRFLTALKSVWEYQPDKSQYRTPGTVEWEAHQEIQPDVQERFETLLDSLSAIHGKTQDYRDPREYFGKRLPKNRGSLWMRMEKDRRKNWKEIQDKLMELREKREKR